MDCDSFPGMSLISGLVYIVGLYGTLFIFYIVFHTMDIFIVEIISTYHQKIVINILSLKTDKQNLIYKTR